MVAVRVEVGLRGGGGGGGARSVGGEEKVGGGGWGWVSFMERAVAGSTRTQPEGLEGSVRACRCRRNERVQCCARYGGPVAAGKGTNVKDVVRWCVCVCVCVQVMLSNLDIERSFRLLFRLHRPRTRCRCRCSTRTSPSPTPATAAAAFRFSLQIQPKPFCAHSVRFNNSVCPMKARWTVVCLAVAVAAAAPSGRSSLEKANPVFKRKDPPSGISAAPVGNDNMAAPPSSRSALPSFLFLLGDDIGWADMSWNGGTANTPRMAEWARRAGSILMQDSHSSGTVCSPTRASVLTGRTRKSTTCGMASCILCVVFFSAYNVRTMAWCVLLPVV